MIGGTEPAPTTATASEQKIFCVLTTEDGRFIVRTTALILSALSPIPMI